MRDFQYPHSNSITSNEYIAVLSLVVKFIEILRHVHSGIFDHLKDWIDKCTEHSCWSNLSQRRRCAREKLKMERMFIRDYEDLKYLTQNLPSTHYVHKVSIINGVHTRLFKLHEEDEEEH